MSPSFSDRIPAGDDRTRRVCDDCGFVDYVNPKIIAGAVVTAADKILLCRRAIEPRRTFWTLPAGFMEERESVEEAARRETREEANASIEIDRVSAGPESMDVQLFDWKDIPWSELAFPTVVWALTHFAQTRHLKEFAPFTNPPGTEAIST